MLKKMLIALVASFAFCSASMAAVDLNTANQQQLEAVKGIGPQKAKAIIDYRTKNGAFKSTGIGSRQNTHQIIRRNV